MCTTRNGVKKWRSARSPAWICMKVQWQLRVNHHLLSLPCLNCKNNNHNNKLYALIRLAHFSISWSMPRANNTDNKNQMFFCVSSQHNYHTYKDRLDSRYGKCNRQRLKKKICFHKSPPLPLSVIIIINIQREAFRSVLWRCKMCTTNAASERQTKNELAMV